MDIELRGITKRFGDLVANNAINLKITAGEILGLLGENGAGKTTLMNILSGLYRPDAGEILIDGKPVRFEGAGDGIRAGIGMVHQHFMLVPVFTAAENVVLGVEPTGRLDHLDLKAAREQVRSISAAHGLEVDPDAIIEELPVGIQQRVEIIKVLFRSASVLIFDEPTAVLTPQEVTEFFGIVRSLRDAGKALVFITHKLHEVLEVADRISVLRSGQIVGEADPKEATEAELAEMMVGRPVRFQVEKKTIAPGRPLLEVKGLTVINEREEVAVNAIDLTVHENEVVGIAGVQGNGQTELVEALTGLRPVAHGSISFLGTDITKASTRERHRMGIAHIPEDRWRSGMIGEFDIAENMVLDSYYDERHSSGITLRWADVHNICVKNVIDFDVRTPSIYSLAEHLSGGNQQKLIVARELSRDVKLVIAAQPTRGLDVGSIEYIHKRMIQARDAGVGVLIVSTELDEILSLSDRILVMFRGRVVGSFESGKVSIGEIGLAMAGGGGVTDYMRQETVSEEVLRRAVVSRFDVEQLVVVPILAVVLALIIGGIIMLATGVPVQSIGESFVALFNGSLGSLYAISETLTAAAPLTLAGLGIALGFRAGLFNIGAEGQVLLGGIAAVVVGFSFPGLPIAIHLPLALIAGAVVGGAWASIAGWLRAATGAHEVITTIMLNLTAMRLVDYLLRNPPVQRPGRTDPISQSVLPSAELPRLFAWFDPTLRVHAGIIMVILAVIFVYWLLFRTTIGFEFRAAGLSPDAARYAGMRSNLIIVVVMALAGALAGLAGANQVLGVLGRASPGFSGGVGFDAIAVALLGRSHPIGVLLAGLLFGALQAGGRQMQSQAGVSLDLIAVIQALIIIFIAAPMLVRVLIPRPLRRVAR